LQELPAFDIAAPPIYVPGVVAFGCWFVEARALPRRFFPRI